MMIFAGENRVTSPYGASSTRSSHGGIDIVGVGSKTVRCVVSGTVDWVQNWDGKSISGNMSYGNCVRIKSGNDYFYYAHLESIAVTKGQSVSVGQAVGVMGSTGNSTGPHTHFEVREGGTSTSCRVDPSAYCGVKNAKGTYAEASATVTAAASSPTATATAAAAKPSYITYTVKKGDTLWAISARYLGKGTRYREIMAASGIKSSTIYVNQKLKIPQ